MLPLALKILFFFNTDDKAVSTFDVSVCSRGCNTDVTLKCDASASTLITCKPTGSFFDELKYSKTYADACTITEPIQTATPFWIEQCQRDDKIIKFYNGFPLF